jgi:hypothetical protein
VNLIIKAALASGLAAIACVPVLAAKPAAFPPPQNYGYDIPVQPDSPWPEMRRDRFNSGNSPIAAH